MESEVRGVLDEKDVSVLNEIFDAKMNTYKIISRLESEVRLLKELYLAQQRELEEIRVILGGKENAG